MNTFDSVQSDEMASRYDEMQELLKESQELRILVVGQGMYPENEILAAMRQVEQAGYFLENGDRVTKGPINHAIAKWRAGSYVSSMTFDEACEKFSEFVKFVSPKDSPSWGSAWYSEKSWPHTYKNNWDTSD